MELSSGKRKKQSIIQESVGTFHISCSLFTKTKGLRSTANMFVVNLAFSDFCMMISQFPMFVHNSFNGGIWLFGPAACELYACLGMI
jgi:r-opsin